jgi:hypothetical protein
MWGKTFRLPVGIVFAPIIVLFLLAGCSRIGGDVRGTVTLNGKPVTSGLVTLHYEGGTNVGAVIGPDGSYEIVKPPKGAAKVTVEPPATAPGGDLSSSGIAVTTGSPDAKEPVKTPKTQAVAIPDKYKKVATSGLTLTVTGNSQTFDIQMVGDDTSGKDKK